jgi:phosphoribosylformylglycinamidine synthase
MWQFKEAVEGLSEGCLAFGIAVTGGNVSFYNETEGLPIQPTPVLGIVGVLEDAAKVITPGFKSAGDAVILIGETREELGGSEYLEVVHGRKDGPAPAVDLAREKAVHEVCLEANDAGWIKSAHDPSDGGLAVCIAECAFHSADGKAGVDAGESAGRLGCELDLGVGPGADVLSPDALLFGESQSRIVVTTNEEDAPKVLELAAKKGVPAAVIGTVGGASIKIARAGRTLVDVTVREARRLWMDAIPAYFRK